MSPQVFVPALAPAAAGAPALGRRVAAAVLHAASLALARAAQRLLATPAARTVQAAPQLEFHAEAGAPEGALYADGVLVGVLEGVNRL